MLVVVTNQFSRAKQEFPGADVFINNTEAIRGFHISPTDELRLHGDELAGYPDGLLDEYQRLVREKRQGTGFVEDVHHDIQCRCCRKSFQSIFDNTIYCPECERLFSSGYCTECGQIFGSTDHTVVHHNIEHGILDLHGATPPEVKSEPEPEPETLELPTVEETELAIESIGSQPQSAEADTYSRMLEQEQGSEQSSTPSNSGLIIP